MSVVKGERKESKVEFDNVYFTIYKDAVRLINCQFGASELKKKEYYIYITEMSKEVLNTVSDIGKHIRIANSIYPIYLEELRVRRIEQEKAIGLCFDLLTKYQLIMYSLGTKDNKYVNEIKNISHEINCLKSWRASDNKRFKGITE